MVCTTNDLTGEGYGFGAQAAASAINHHVLISFCFLFVSGPNLSRSRSTVFLTHYPCAKETGNGRATDSSRTWPSGGGFSSRTSSIGPGFTVNIGCFETCNLPSVEGHSSGYNCRRSPFLCAQPATAQVSRPCASDQDRAGRHGHWIRHHVAVQPLPRRYVLWFLILFLIRFTCFFFFFPWSATHSWRDAIPVSCSLISPLPFPATRRQCPTLVEESKQIV